MKTTATTEAVSSPPEEKWHLSQQWRQNTFRAGQKPRSDWKNDLQTYEEGRKSRKPPTPFVGIKPYGKSQFTEHVILFSPFITIVLIALVVFYVTKALLRFIKPNKSLI